MSPYAITVEFVDGFFAAHIYKAESIQSLCTLIRASSVLNSKTFLEVENKDKKFKIQIYCENQKCCVFQDTYKHAIKIIGTPGENEDIHDYVQIWDARWGTTNFLPTHAFVAVMNLADVIGRPLIMGELGRHFEYAQSFPDSNPPDGYC